jgi:hypothetical protein
MKGEAPKKNKLLFPNPSPPRLMNLTQNKQFRGDGSRGKKFSQTVVIVVGRTWSSFVAGTQYSQIPSYCSFPKVLQAPPLPQNFHP